VTIVDNVIDPLKDQHTALRYELAKDGMVSIQVFSLAGDLVRTLIRARQSAGSYTVAWDGRNGRGEIVARGVYFIRVVATGIDEYRKVLIIK